MKKLYLLLTLACLFTSSASAQMLGDELFIKVSQGKMGYADITGKEVIPCVYDLCFDFKPSGLAKVVKDGFMGVVDNTGKIVVPFYFEFVYFNPISPTLIAVMINNKWGVYTQDGTMLITPRSVNEDVKFLSEHLVAIYSAGVYSLINDKGEKLGNVTYDRVQAESEGLLAVKNFEKYGYINERGELLIPYQYEDAKSFHQGLAAVKLKGKWGYINPKGEFVIEPKYAVAEDFQDGMALVHKKDQAEERDMIDKQGELIASLTFKSLGEFHDGVAVIENQNGDPGLINTRGQMVVPFEKYFKIIPDRNGYIRVDGLGEGVKWGCIDPTGKILIPLKYDMLGWYSEGLALFGEKNKYGYLDTAGRVVISPSYEKAFMVTNGSAAVKKFGSWEWGAINMKGETVIPFAYDEISAYNAVAYSIYHKRYESCTIQGLKVAVLKGSASQVYDRFGNRL
jgi:hypothetical protein